MMTHLILAATLLTGAAEFEARTLDGRTVQGQLVELNAKQVVLEGADGRTTLPLDTLATVARKGPEAPAAPKATLWVELVDQSGLAAVEYTVEGDTAHVATTGAVRLDIPTRSIAWVRFRPPADGDDKLAKQWSDALATKPGGDLLVVRKNDALDYLEGIQGDVDAATCKFEVDQEVIPVKREKVEGIVYFHPAAAELADPVGQASVVDGSRLSMAGATLGDGSVQVSTPGGVTLALPLDTVVQLDFTAGKVAYLSDLTPESAEYTPYFGFKDQVPALGEYFQYRRDIGFDRGPLRVEGKAYAKGLALQTRTVLAYKLPGKFRLLQATVGIDDSVRPSGSAHLEITADGKPLWQGDIRGNEPAQALELDIAGAKRLQIVADFGDDLDIGDRVNLCEARVTK